MHTRKEGCCILPENYSSGRDPRRNYDERYARSAAPRSQNARPAGQRSAARPAGQRSANARPQGNRPQGSRPPQGRRPAPRRKKRTQPRFFVILAILAILVIALILIFGGGGKQQDVVTPQATPVPASNASGMSNATISSQAAEPSAVNEGTSVSSEEVANANYSTLSQWLDDEDSEVAALSEDDMVQVKDLSVNTSLSSEWTNVLLLGTDERTLSESARTDAMIICSINTTTGEVKLTSIMRDLAVDFDELGKYSGTYRINSANYFGGPEYAIKTVNECFNLNIQHYVTVNFFGFQKIAQALGGIEVDISQAEMEEINKRAVEQAWIAYNEGIDESDQINEYLETYGANTHLNGRQTLAYARIRHTDSDFSRAERQRTVLVKLMDKLRGKSLAEISALALSLSSNVQTNMNMNDVVEIAYNVLKSGLTNVDTFRLPVNGTYKQERRNDKDMYYDCDWAANQRELYNFIYE